MKQRTECAESISRMGTSEYRRRLGEYTQLRREQDKSMATAMLEEGFSYEMISKVLGLSTAVVRSYGQAKS